MTKATSSEVITLPKGGGALQDIGEKFSPNLICIDTGNFIVPISLPPGQNDSQPQLSLVYSSGNDPYGLGWDLSIPDVSLGRDPWRQNVTKKLSMFSSYPEQRIMFPLKQLERLSDIVFKQKGR